LIVIKIMHVKIAMPCNSQQKFKDGAEICT